MPDATCNGRPRSRIWLMKSTGRLTRLVVATGLAAGVAGLALGGNGSGSTRKTTCRPSWFVPTVRVRIDGHMVDVSDTWTFLSARAASCFIAKDRPFSALVNVTGRNGYLLTTYSDAMMGDEISGGGGGGGSTVALEKWCAHQPVRVEVIGIGPDYATTGQGYHLVLNGVRIRC